ncbi:MAG: hypothetical protein WCT12_35615 [Verrucomicrobiota bacterium]
MSPTKAVRLRLLRTVAWEVQVWGGNRYDQWTFSVAVRMSFIKTETPR